ncbi:MAG: hypothetical protein DWQ02_15720 [Bacteroidetes bacterium]|nr:MAG: hypothetical protein DWQ02_15720 [Bacteroidota bacterium]
MKNKLVIIICAITVVLIGWNCSFDEIPIPEPEPDPNLVIPPIPVPDGPYPIDLVRSEYITIDLSNSLDSVLVRFINASGDQGDILDSIRLYENNYPIKMRHQRYWLNLGSRLVGPGTSYSFTYTWTEGTTVTESESFTHTAGIEFKSSFSFFGAESSLTLSYEFSSTFESTKTVSQEKSGSETQTVEAKEGVNRVYTVWQLMDVYDFVDSTGAPVTKQILEEQVKLARPDIEVIKEVQELPFLTNGTPSIAQSTFDFPI